MPKYVLSEIEKMYCKISCRNKRKKKEKKEKKKRRKEIGKRKEEFRTSMKEKV